MKFAPFLIAASFLLSVGMASEASAQIIDPRSYAQQYIFNRPTVSPYLNLLNSTNQFSQQPAYQTLVRPLLEQRQDAQFQQREISQIRQQVNTLGQLSTAGNFRPAVGDEHHAVVFRQVVDQGAHP